MNSTGPSVPDNDLLCPLDNRRSSKEIYLRFFIVNFTTLSFYLHFIRRRDGTYLAGNPVLFVLAPLNLVFRYTLGVFGILSVFSLQILINLLRHGNLDSVSRDAFLTTPLNWLFGKSRVDDYSGLPTSDSEQDESSRPRITLSSYIGRFLVNGLFITQCVGSIFLYIRRRQHSAVTQLDEKVFGAALGGLVVGLLNVCRSISLPTFDEYVPSDNTTNNSDNKTAMDRFALLCRDSCRESLLAFNDDHPHWLRFFKNLIITVLILLVSSSSGLFEGMHNLWAKLVERYNEDPELVYSGFGFIFLICIVFGFAIPWIPYQDGKKNGRPNVLNRYPFLLAILSPMSGALMIVLVIIMTVIGFAGIYALGISWSFSYFLAFDEAANLTATPTNVTCPLLWSDPVAAYVWGLA
jgi:hypothetical protein